jgi:4-amino-4-deoxy-L-arabinose transferase-like glycosyltransferase
MRMQVLPPNPERQSTAFWLAVLLLGLCVYALGIGGQYVPTNGDEMVYAHIARETAETGQWLPLASELGNMRNTKPPLLIWQAMVAGQWGEHWTLAALRAPSLLYLLLICGGIVLSLRAATQRWREGLIAACVFLAFLSTFRYGRPYLTSAAETFWFSLPMFALIIQRARLPAAGPGWIAHSLFGLALGLGLAYKSFALVAPAAATWWLALVASESHLGWPALLRHTLRVAFSALLALGVFALWFVLDPDPQSVWREFIVGENAAKFADTRGYWRAALSFDGSGIWSQLLAYAVNAGLLFFVLPGLAWLGLKALPQLRQHWPQPAAQVILLAWAAVWLLVFLFPSQRSARYVIPAMPAVAMLIALHWRDIPRAWFLPTLLLAAPALLVLARLGWVGHEIQLASTGDIGLTLGLIGIGALCIVAGLLRSAWSRGSAVLTTLLVYAAFNAMVTPMDGPTGRYDERAIAAAPAGRIAVPSGFNGQFERFQFLLPGQHQFQPYDSRAQARARRGPDAEGQAQAAEELHRLLNTHEAVIWTASHGEQTAPPCLPGCRVLGERWLLTSRHAPGEIRKDNLWYPQQWLYRREWLLVRS